MRILQASSWSRQIQQRSLSEIRSRPVNRTPFNSRSITMGKERLVILGSGWASDVLQRQVDLKKYDTTVVAPSLSYTYTPMLASVAVGSLTLFATMDGTKKPGIRTFAATVEEIDVKGKKVACKSAVDAKSREFEVPYDVLVVAVGCAVQDFGTEGVKEHALFFKTVQDAVAVRNRLIECFDAASLPGASEQERRDLLHFIIVGGGATGIELAAELTDLIGSDIERLYGKLAKEARVSIYDVAPKILPGFDKDLQDHAKQTFQRKNVDVETEKHIEKLESGVMHVKETGPVKFGMLVWSTGLDAVPLLKNGIKGTKQDEKTRNLITDDYLRVLDTNENPIPGVYAMGDLCTPKSGKLPPVGAVAHQEAEYIGRLLSNSDFGKFHFKDSRKVSYLGSQESVQQKGDSGSTGGRGAWALWREEYSRNLTTKRRFIIFIYSIITWLGGRDLVRI